MRFPPLCSARSAAWTSLLLLLLGPAFLLGETPTARVDFTLTFKQATAAKRNGSLRLRPLSHKGTERVLAIDSQSSIQAELPANTVWEVAAELSGFWAPRETVWVGPAGTGTQRPIVLWPAAEIEGSLRLKEPSEKLPKEMTVTLESPPGPAAKREIPKGQASCPVDEKGAFRCILPAAPLDVAFRAAGFVPQYRWGLAPRQGQALKVGVIELKKGASLKGWIEVEDGPIVAGQCVARLFPIVSAGGGDPTLTERLRRAAAEARVGPDGFFQLSGVAPGSYQLEVEQPGYATARIFPVDVWLGAETALKQSVILKRPVRIELTLKPAADWLDKPWRIKVLRAADASSGYERKPVHDGPVDAEGRVSIPGQGPGRFLVTVADSRGDGLLSEEMEITGPADARRDIEIRLITVEGNVTLGRDPLAATLFFGKEKGAVSVKMESDEDGRFHGVLPREGTWRVDVRSADGAVGTFIKTKVEADRAGRARVQLRIPDTRVFGKVVNEEGQPVQEAEIGLSSETESIEALSDEQGRFEIRGAPEGVVHLAARASGKERLSGDVMTLALADSQEVGPLELRLRRIKALRGQVRGVHGPVAGATVVAQPLQPPVGFAASARAGVDGVFELEIPARTDRVQLVVSPPGYSLKTYQLEADGAQMILNVPQDGGTLEFSLPYKAEEAREEDLAYVVFQNGLPLHRPQLMSWARGHGGRYSDASGADFQIPQLAPGDYRVCVVKRAAFTDWALSGWQKGAAECVAGPLASGGTLRLSVARPAGP